MTGKLTDRIAYRKVLSKLQELFDNKLEEVRKDDKNKGKYLIGSGAEPWNRLEFSIGKKEDYEDYPKDPNEILIEREI